MNTLDANQRTEEGQAALTAGWDHRGLALRKPPAPVTPLLFFPPPRVQHSCARFV
jgi:hypothetical protein